MRLLFLTFILILSFFTLFSVIYSRINLTLILKNIKEIKTKDDIKYLRKKISKLKLMFILTIVSGILANLVFVFGYLRSYVKAFDFIYLGIIILISIIISLLNGIFEKKLKNIPTDNDLLDERSSILKTYFKKI